MIHLFYWHDAGPPHDPRAERAGVCSQCGKTVVLKRGERVELDGCELPRATGHDGYKFPDHPVVPRKDAKFT